MRAVILAAGLGSRSGLSTHKALYEVQNEKNIVRNIRFLKEAGVREITVVTGHLAADFHFLRAFGVELVYNDKFAELNNAYSLSLVVERLEDCFVLDADVVFLKNVIEAQKESVYYLTKRPKSELLEYVPILGSDDFVKEIAITNKEEPSLLGLHFFNKEAALMIKEAFLALDESFYLQKSAYYDDVIASLLPELKMRTKVIDNALVCEIDKPNDMKELESKLERLNHGS